MNKLRTALLGFGDAGRAFARLLSEKHDEIIEKYDTDVIVTAISTKTRGTIIDSDGIDLLKACDDIMKYGKFAPDTKGLCDSDSFDVLKKADYDVMCELTPISIRDGQPAIDHIKTAFRRGKHVITANKGPIAWAFDELREMADENKCLFFYETTVMDGTPVFNLAEHTLKMCRVTEVSGILNSATNYVLGELAQGKDYDEVIENGKKRGFIEADPSMDMDGYDAAAKVTALLNVLAGAGITPEDVDITGIGGITYEDIKDAEKRGKSIKLLCKGIINEDGSAEAFVKPVEVSNTDLLATVDATTSVVSITTDLMGKISVVEHDPEIEQTAYGIFGDILRVIEER